MNVENADTVPTELYVRLTCNDATIRHKTKEATEETVSQWILGLDSFITDERHL